MPCTAVELCSRQHHFVLEERNAVPVLLASPFAQFWHMYSSVQIQHRHFASGSTDTKPPPNAAFVLHMHALAQQYNQMQTRMVHT